jgi:hypothetical protein
MLQHWLGQASSRPITIEARLTIATLDAQAPTIVARHWVM